MSQFSNYLEDILINAVLRNTAYTSPTTVYVALYTSDPGEDNSGTELAGNGYARQAITFGAPSNGVTSNSGDVTFGPASASWGTVTHVGILDASTLGNLLFYGPLSASKTVGDTDSLTLSTSNVTVTLA